MSLQSIFDERMKVLPIVAAMERRGVSISKPRLDELRGRFKAQAAEAGERMLAIAAERGFALDLPKGASPNKSLRQFCFDVLDLPRVYDPKSKTGEPTVGQKAVDEWRVTLAEGDALDFVLASSKRAKRCTQVAYADGYERFWLPGGGPDWKVLHGNLNPTGTVTLRFSHSRPNTGNVSKQSIACFTCLGDDKECPECGGRGVEPWNLRYPFGPAPGREWWCLDYENIELRIPGYEAGERKMIELFERPDEPPYFGSYHLLIASIIWPDEFWPLAEERDAFKNKYKATLYQWTKNFNFAKQYNCGQATGDRAARKRGAFDAVESELHAVTALNRKYVEDANKLGFIETLPDKTVDPSRGYPLLCTRNERARVKPTEPFAYHVSGSAMWCTMKAMNRCAPQLAAWTADDPRGYWLAMQIHDELVFDFPAGGRANLPKVRKLQMLMSESGDDIGVPLSVAVTWCPHDWSKGEELV